VSLASILLMAKELADIVLAMDRITGASMGKALAERKREVMEIARKLREALDEEADGKPVYVVTTAVALFVAGLAEGLAEAYGSDAGAVLDDVVVKALKFLLMARGQVQIERVPPPSRPMAG